MAALLRTCFAILIFIGMTFALACSSSKTNGSGASTKDSVNPNAAADDEMKQKMEEMRKKKGS